MIEQKIHFVTGKGGVGKSCVALALAKHLSQKGLSVLLIELGQISFFTDHLQIPISYAPLQWKQNLSIAIWSGADCLKEYALHLLKIEALYNLFFENKLSKSLIEVAPSLPELSILGKITSGLRKVGPPLKFDCIVVDGFSTGHMISLLKAPRGMLEAIPIGPMGEQTRGILEIIKNKNVCNYWITCLPEELPVIESIELAQLLYNETQIKPHLVINKLLNQTEIDSLQGSSDSELKFINTLKNKIIFEKSLINQLIESDCFKKFELNNISKSNTSNSSDFLQIPFFYESNSEILLDLMSTPFFPLNLNFEFKEYQTL